VSPISNTRATCLNPSSLSPKERRRSFPDLEPLYTAARSYLEISQRIDLLNARVDVLQDMLMLLKESVNSSHGEQLEAIVIVLMWVNKAPTTMSRGKEGTRLISTVE
jgi:hypothetical protein